MTFRALIMGFYLVALSLIPCGDSQECFADEQHIAASSQSHEQHEHTTEACSPLCNCSCCVSYFYPQPDNFRMTMETPFRIFNLPSEVSILSHDFKSIWHPPKIS